MSESACILLPAVDHDFPVRQRASSLFNGILEELGRRRATGTDCGRTVQAITNIRQRSSITSKSPLLAHTSSYLQEVYLCATVKGRVGNAFFAYMSVLGIARANNLTLVFKDESVLKDVIKHPPQTDPQFEQKCTGAVQLEQPMCGSFNKALMTLKRTVSAYSVSSCLVSWVYFDRLRDMVNTILQFRPDVEAKARAIVTGVRAATRGAMLVGVHVRRGDQVSKSQQASGHVPVTPGYLSRAMLYFTRRFSPVHFVVASDDHKWCRTFVARDRKDVTIPGNNSAAVDFAMLTLTDHMIISTGTYGWWAGYLNPGIKLYMKGFVKPASKFSRSFSSLDPADYFYPGWIPLDP